MFYIKQFSPVRSLEWRPHLLKRVAYHFALDPRIKEFPHWTPYLFAANNPVSIPDINGEGPPTGGTADGGQVTASNGGSTNISGTGGTNNGSLTLGASYKPKLINKRYVSQSYNFGYNGKEVDLEGLGGGGVTYDYGFRIYNPALGKFLSVDPLSRSYPFFSPYQFSSNNPIKNIDIDGKEGEDGQKEWAKEKATGTGNVMIIYDASNEMNDEMKSSKLVNEKTGWDYVYVTDMQAAADYMEKYAAKYGKVNNLVIRSHGDIPSGDRKPEEVYWSINTEYNENGHLAGNITTEGLSGYYSGNPDPNQEKTIKNISRIGKCLANNATVIVGACGLGRNDKLCSGIVKLLDPDKNKDMTVYFNKGQTDRLRILNFREHRDGISNSDAVNLGWKDYNSSGRVIGLKYGVSPGIPKLRVSVNTNGSIHSFNAGIEPKNQPYSPFIKTTK